MGTSKNIVSYPGWFFEVPEKLKGQANLRIPHLGKAQAFALRQQFYGWRKLDEVQALFGQSVQRITVAVKETTGEYTLTFARNGGVDDEILRSLGLTPDSFEGVNDGLPSAASLAGGSTREKVAPERVPVERIPPTTLAPSTDDATEESVEAWLTGTPSSTASPAGGSNSDPVAE